MDKTERMSAADYQARGASQKTANRIVAVQQQRVTLAQSKIRPIIYVGLDPGKFTGFAIWHTSRPANLNGMPPQTAQFVEVTTYTFVQAIRRLEQLVRDFGPIGIRVRIEDVRGRVGIFRQREKGNEAVQDRKAQNIGSNKRDCQLLCDFMEDLGIEYDAIPPKPKSKGGKIGKENFIGVRGFPARTSQHARDAAALVCGL